MWEIRLMSKHLVDHKRAGSSGRVVHFLRIARTGRAAWHRAEALPLGNRRVMEFLRIARGRLV
jgi:hypothetical protein